MFREMDRYFAHQRREELAREFASERLGRRLRGGRSSFQPPRRAAKLDAGPAGGGLRPDGI